LKGGYEDPPEDPPPKGDGGVAGRRDSSKFHGGRQEAVGEILSPHCSCPCQAKPLLLLVGRRVGRAPALPVVLGVPGNSGAAWEPNFDCLMHYYNRAG
jgi:hypothetical protein